MHFASLRVSPLLLFFGLSLAAPVIFQEPVSNGSVNSTSEHMAELYRRDGTDGCGVNLRRDNTEKCEANNLQFTWDTKTNTLKALTKTGAAEDPTGECDHALELQVLARALEGNGVCNLLTRVAEAAQLSSPKSTTLSEFKKEMLTPLTNAINGQTNAFFLSHDINQKKGDIVGGFLSGNPHPAASPEVNAVHTYYQNQVIRTKTAQLATQLDTLMRQMVTDIMDSTTLKAGIAKIPNSKTSSRPDRRAEAIRNINNLRTGWLNANAPGTPGAVTVAGTWAQFLNWV